MNKSIKYLEYVRRSKAIKEENIGTERKKLKIAILRSFTVETIEPILKVESHVEKIYADIFLGEYNQYYQEIYNDNSDFYKFNPDICILAIRLEELYPSLLNNFIDQKDSLEDIKTYIINQYKNMIGKIKKNLKCNILINNFILPYNNYTSLYDFQYVNGQANFMRKLNLELVELAGSYTGVYVVDLDNMSSLLGKLNIQDKKMWYLAKNPYKYEFYVSLAKEYIKYFKAIFEMKKKCVVLDLDNTLWGGIVGEDGIDGIKLGDSYPGICYKDFQYELLKLKKRGVILAICSKNNIEDVDEVFQKHPDMILKKTDFACIKVNWEDKYKNINAIAEELNIGVDSLVFIDDNPVECELVNNKIPEVIIINLSGNPMEYCELIFNCSYFETIKLTAEDLEKTNIYKAQIDRNNLMNSSGDLDEYYRNLEIKVEIREEDRFSIPRIAQLTQKTNQFNLTTKRYTEEDIKKLSESDSNKIYYIRVIDKFGDNGITGCCILKQIDAKTTYIDTFLLSCRIMGRNIENAFMSFIYSKLKEMNVTTVIGEYIPSKKNMPVKDFYKNLGFAENIENKYVLNIGEAEIKCPSYIEII